MNESITTWHLRIPDWDLSHLEFWSQHSPLPSTVIPTRYDWEGFVALAQSQPRPTRVLLWLTPSMVLELRATVPAMSHGQLRDRVPYAIEESLIADLESEHFALGIAESLPGGQLNVPLRITRSTPFSQLLQRLKDFADLTPDAIYSEADALPPKPGDLQVWLEGEEARLRHPDGRWLVTSAMELVSALRWLEPGSSTLGIWVIVAREARAEWEPILSAEAARFSAVRWQVIDGSPLGWLSRRATDTGSEFSGPINLMQGPWAVRRRTTISRAWRWPIGLVASALFLLVAVDTLMSSKAQHRERALDQALTNSRVALSGEDRGTLREPMTLLSQGLQTAVTLRGAWPEAELLQVEGDAQSLVIELTVPPDQSLTEGPWDPTRLPAGALTLNDRPLMTPSVTKTERGWRWAASTAP